jgi:Replicative DNA helicase
MLMNSPPITRKRGGDLAATTPNCFASADDTPLVCSAQTWRTEQPCIREKPQDMADPPHSLEAEKGVLGSMLQQHGQSEAIAACSRKINAEYFYAPTHRDVFTVICDLWDAQKAIDIITLTDALRDRGDLEKVGGSAYLAELFTFVPTAANIQFYIDIVLDKYLLRETMRAAEISIRRSIGTQDDEPAAILDELESRIASLRSLHGRNGFLPQIQDAAAAINQQIILPPDVIESILHLGGKLVFGGGSKSFKTWLLIDLAISVATGSPWLNGYLTTKGRVLYINLELPKAFCEKRIQTICDEHQVKLGPGMLDLWHLRGYAMRWPELKRRIQSGVYALIIIDPIYKILLGRDEIKAGDIALAMNELDELAVRTSAAVAFGAHYSKGNQALKESIDRISGSGVFARDPDSILTFTSHEEPDCFTVEMTLRNHPPQKSFVVRWQFPLFIVDGTLDPAQLKRRAGGAPRKVKDDELLELFTPSTRGSQVVPKATARFDCGERAIYDGFKRLREAGQLILKDGEYERPFQNGA